jgi:hypothetical protein
MSLDDLVALLSVTVLGVGCLSWGVRGLGGHCKGYYVPRRGSLGFGAGIAYMMLPIGVYSMMWAVWMVLPDTVGKGALELGTGLVFFAALVLAAYSTQ